MKKYTDTELLEILLPMLSYLINYSTITGSDGGSILDTVDFRILESNNFVSKSFVVALQNRMNKLAKKIQVEIANNTAEHNDDYKKEQEVNRACMPVEDNRDYKEEYRKMVKENHRLKVLIELLLEEIDYLRQ